MKWKKGEFIRKVFMGFGDNREDRVTAGYVSDCGRFGIYRDDTVFGRDWFLIHLQTGWAVLTFDKFRPAKSAAESLAHLDWDFRSPQSKKVKILAPHVRRVRGELPQ